MVIRTDKRSSRRHQRGYFLLEVMITVVVLSIGLLGLGALQVHSKQTNMVAAQRTFVSHLAHDLLERMRSNDEGLASYIGSDSVVTLTGSSMSVPASSCVSGSMCDPVQLAAYDLWEWEQKLAGAMSQIASTNAGVLLSPTACISRPSGGGSGTYTVAIAWRSTKPIENPAVPTNATAGNCGTSSGKYGTGNEMRHLLWIESFIAES